MTEKIHDLKTALEHMTQTEALKLALDWIGSAPHGDNCFLHDDGEYNRCFCGKDSLEKFIEEVLAQPEQEPVAWATREDFYRELDSAVNRMRQQMEIKGVFMRCADCDIVLPVIYIREGYVWVEQVITPKLKPLTNKQRKDMGGT